MWHAVSKTRLFYKAIRVLPIGVFRNFADAGEGEMHTGYRFGRRNCKVVKIFACLNGFLWIGIVCRTSFRMWKLNRSSVEQIADNQQ